MDKRDLRKILLSKLSALTFEELQSLSFRLTNQLVKFFNFIPELSDQIGGAYLPLQNELAPAYQELLNQVPVTLSFPVLIEEKMAFGISSGIPKGHIWLEAPYHKVDPAWLLVPGLGFDLSGARLGRGKGHYDRFLQTHDVLKVGIAWSQQILQKVPMEEHDCHMDFIITEDFCWNISQQIKF